MGKQIKDLGVLLIVVGAASLLLILFSLISYNPQSPLFIIVDRCFLFLLIGGLVSLLVGVITRSIGKAKEEKDRESGGK